jgi:hypothetical protein
MYEKKASRNYIGGLASSSNFNLLLSVIYLFRGNEKLYLKSHMLNYTKYEK